MTSQECKGAVFWFTVRLGLSLGLESEVEVEVEVEEMQPEGPTNARLNGRILIAEENPINREVATGMLKR